MVGLHGIEPFIVRVKLGRFHGRAANPSDRRCYVAGMLIQYWVAWRYRVCTSEF